MDDQNNIQIQFKYLDLENCLNNMSKEQRIAITFCLIEANSYRDFKGVHNYSLKKCYSLIKQGLERSMQLLNKEVLDA